VAVSNYFTTWLFRRRTWLRYHPAIHRAGVAAALRSGARAAEAVTAKSGQRLDSRVTGIGARHRHCGRNQHGRECQQLSASQSRGTVWLLSWRHFLLPSITLSDMASSSATTAGECCSGLLLLHRAFWLFVNPPWKIAAVHYAGVQWAFLFVFSMISVLGAFSLYFLGLQHLEPTRAIIASCLEPVFSILPGCGLLGEMMHAAQRLGDRAGSGGYRHRATSSRADARAIKRCGRQLK